MPTPDISIISSGASLADARLHRIVNALTRAGLNVEVLAPGNSADALWPFLCDQSIKEEDFNGACIAPFIHHGERRAKFSTA